MKVCFFVFVYVRSNLKGDDMISPQNQHVESFEYFKEFSVYFRVQILKNEMITNDFVDFQQLCL